MVRRTGKAKMTAPAKARPKMPMECSCSTFTLSACPIRFKLDSLVKGHANLVRYTNRQSHNPDSIQTHGFSDTPQFHEDGCFGHRSAVDAHIPRLGRMRLSTSSMPISERCPGRPLRKSLHFRLNLPNIDKRIPKAAYR